MRLTFLSPLCACFVLSNALIACSGSSSTGNTAAVGGASGGSTSTAGTSSYGTAGANPSNSGGTSNATGGTPSTAANADHECAPVAYTEEPLNMLTSRETPCRQPAESFGLPNPAHLIVSDLSLPQPTEAGKPYAISINFRTESAENIEIWGSNDTCGTAAELLWYAPASTQRFCAQFVPSAAYSHVLFVIRPMQYGISTLFKGFSICPAGTCASPDGTGKQSGVTLSAPAGAYEIQGSILRPSSAIEVTLVPRGRIVLLPDKSVPVQNNTSTVLTGYFRMPSTDPYGDAWYCAGSGSTFTLVSTESMVPIKYRLSLKNITRLGTCAGKTGPQSASLSYASTADVTSTVPSLAGTGLWGAVICRNTWCTVGYSGYSPTAKYVWLELLSTGDAGTISSPTNATLPISEAAFFVQSSDTAALQLACSSSGNFQYSPQTKTTATVNSMTDFGGCSGTPIANDTLEANLF